MKLDESLRAAQPAAPPARLSAGHEAEPEPEGGAGCAELLTLLEPGAIDALGGCKHVLVACDQTGRPGEPIQIRGTEWALLIGGLQRRKGVVPLATVVAGAPAEQKPRAFLYRLRGGGPSAGGDVGVLRHSE